MAQAEATAKKATKKATRRANAQKEIKGVGKEPDLSVLTEHDPNYGYWYTRAMNWANTALDPKKEKKETIAYTEKKRGIKNHGLGSLEEHKFIGAVGKIAYFANRDATLRQQSIDYMHNTIDGLIEEGRAKAKAQRKEQKRKEEAERNLPAEKSPAERERQKRDDAFEELDMLYVEESIMKKPNEARMQKDPQAPYNILNKYKLKQQSVQWIISKLTELYQELGEIGKDKQVTEAYNCYTKGEVSRHKRWLKSMIDQANNYMANLQANRKPRKKTKSADQQVKNVKYKPHDPTYQLDSVDPASIVGASMLVIFNTKSRKLGYYVAKDENGLQIKGTSLQNWDIEKSAMKTLRKPQEQLPGFRKANKKRVQVLLRDNINGKWFKMNGRLNADTVLMAVYK